MVKFRFSFVESYRGTLSRIWYIVLHSELPEETREKLIHNFAYKLAGRAGADGGLKYFVARLQVYEFNFFIICIRCLLRRNGINIIVHC